MALLVLVVLWWYGVSWVIWLLVLLVLLSAANLEATADLQRRRSRSRARRLTASVRP